MIFDEKILEGKYVQEELEKIIPQYCRITFKCLDLLLAKIMTDYIFPMQREININKSDAAQKWEIERVEKYWYWSGRNSKTYKEVTFWVAMPSLKRKEFTRVHHCIAGNEWDNPDWVNTITNHNKVLSESLRV